MQAALTNTRIPSVEVQGAEDPNDAPELEVLDDNAVGLDVSNVPITLTVSQVLAVLVNQCSFSDLLPNPVYRVWPSTPVGCPPCYKATTVFSVWANTASSLFLLQRLFYCTEG